MKKFAICILSLFFAIMLCACGGQTSGGVGQPPSTPAQTSAISQAPDEPQPSQQPSQSVASEKQQDMTEAEFLKLLTQLPLTVDSTKYVIQDEQYKALYPDMLQAILYNHTDADIKNAIVAFVAWDANGLPVKIKGSIDFTDGAYIKQVNYSDINLIPGATFGETSGFEVDENCRIDFFQAVVVSFETFGGDSWSNPYYSAWCELYEGVKHTSDLSVTVTLKDASFSGTSDSPASGGVNEAELLATLDAQDVRVISTKYVVQDAQYKALYPDMLQAVIVNNTDVDIKNAVVAFAAWDANGLPVKIKGSVDFTNGAYIKQVNYSDINLIPGATFGENSGFEVDEACGIATFRAVVVSYEDFEGTTWENPYYQDWCKLYEGVKLG